MVCGLLWGGVIFFYFQFVKLFEQIETWNSVHRQVLSYIWRFCKKCEYFLWFIIIISKAFSVIQVENVPKQTWDFCNCRVSSEVIVYFYIASIWSFILIGENGGIFWKECSRFRWKFHANAAWRMPLMESDAVTKWALVLQKDKCPVLGEWKCATYHRLSYMVSQKCPNVGDRDVSYLCHNDLCVCADLLHNDNEKVQKKTAAKSCKQCRSRSISMNPMLALILRDPCELRNNHMTIMSHFLVLYCWHSCFYC